MKQGELTRELIRLLNLVDINQKVVQHRAWIERLAERFAKHGHYRLNKEDLVADAYLVMCRVAQKAREPDFDQVFRAAVWNWYRDILRHVFRPKHKEHMVDIDLSRVSKEITFDGIKEIYYNEKLAEARSILSPMAFKFLNEWLVNPSEETTLEAVRGYVRGHHLYQTGQRKYLPRFRINIPVVKKVLGLTWREVHDIKEEFKQKFGGMYASTN